MLRMFLRRWGVYLAVGGCLAGAGAPALAAWSVLPLFWSLQHPLQALGALVLYAGVGELLLWAARPLLWPVAWAETERALPIPRGQVWLADLEAVLLVLAPLALLLLAGAAVLRWQDPAWLRPHQGLALAALGLALLGAAGLAVLALHGLRRAARPQGAFRPRGRWREAAGPPVVRLHGLGALVGLALWRGAAPRTMRALGLGLVVLVLLAAAPAGAPGPMAGWLMAWALVSHGMVTRLQALQRQELAPLWSACRSLPVSPAVALWAAAGLAGLPAANGLLVLLLATAGLPVRAPVLAALGLVSVANWLLELRAVPADPAAHGARWLLGAALLAALASQVPA